MNFDKATKEEMSAEYLPTRGAKPKWPFAMMDIGDAVEVTGGQYGKSNPQIYASVYGRQSGKKFRSRKIAEDTWRIWRIS